MKCNEFGWADLKNLHAPRHSAQQSVKENRLAFYLLMLFIRKTNKTWPGAEDVLIVRPSVPLVALDGREVLFIRPLVDVGLTLQVALTFFPVEKITTSLSYNSLISWINHCFFLCITVKSSKTQWKKHVCILCPPEPFAHYCLKELPGRALSKDFPVTVCKDGISVTSKPTDKEEKQKTWMCDRILWVLNSITYSQWDSCMYSMSCFV